MHILFLCNEYPPGNGGGVGSFTRSLARSLVKSGCTVTVLGQQRVASETIEDDQGVTVKRTPAVYTPVVNPFVNAVNLYRNILKIHRQTPVDIIDGQEIAFWALPKAMPGVKILRMNGGHHFFSFTLGGKPKLLRGLAEKFSFRNADFICAVSRFSAEETRRLLKLGDVPIRILPNPVDVHQFAPRPDITEEEGNIIFAGTLCEKKGIRQLIEAMSIVSTQIPGARLIVAGRDSLDPITKGSYLEGLKRIIPPNLQESIHFLGPIAHTELVERIARAQVCVYPSHMEAMPLAWLEGLAMGKCVIASQTGPGPEVITHGKDGLLCDPHDPVSIAQNMILALNDAELRSRLGLAARNKIEENFSAEVMAKRNIDFYLECMRDFRACTC